MRFGAVQPQYLPPGLNIITPFVNSVYKVDIRLKSVGYSSLASSKDLQQVNAEVTFQYYLINHMVPEVYKNIGDRDKIESTILQPAIAESLKSVTANYTAEELITKRSSVKNSVFSKIEEFVHSSLYSKNLNGALKMSNLAITHFQFSEEFNRAIELKVKTEQQALQA